MAVRFATFARVFVVLIPTHTGMPVRRPTLSRRARAWPSGSLDEAQAYLRHPVLGNRLRTCTATVNRVAGRSSHEIFGAPDDAKFRSSMMLFALADAELVEFRIALTQFFDGEADPRTRTKLGLS